MAGQAARRPGGEARQSRERGARERHGREPCRAGQGRVARHGSALERLAERSRKPVRQVIAWGARLGARRRGAASGLFTSPEGKEPAGPLGPQRPRRRTVGPRLEEGRQRQRRGPPPAAASQPAQVAGAQPAHHPALAHLKAPRHLCRRQRPVFKHELGSEIRLSSPGSTIDEDSETTGWHSNWRRGQSELRTFPDPVISCGKVGYSFTFYPQHDLFMGAKYYIRMYLRGGFRIRTNSYANGG